MRPEINSENPNSDDLPPGEPGDVPSRDGDRDDQQVMSAQAASARSSMMMNGTYGSVAVGPMSMDSELRGPSRDEVREGVAGIGSSVGTSDESGVGALRAVAGRVMTNVAAKMQGVLPTGRSGSASGFLPQEESVSVGTAETGFVTAASRSSGEARPSELREPSGSGLFSPQQAQRLREMPGEAPLLFAGGGASGQGGRPTVSRPSSVAPPLPHSSSSDSGQAEAIQAEVRRQMEAFVTVQNELQRRVVALTEENHMLRQVVVAPEQGLEGLGPQGGRGSWLSGLRKNILGFVQQVPGKAPAASASVVEGWQSEQPSGHPPYNPPPAQYALPFGSSVLRSNPFVSGVPPPPPHAQGLDPSTLGSGLGPQPVVAGGSVSAASSTVPAIAAQAACNTAGVGHLAKHPPSGLGGCSVPHTTSVPQASGINAQASGGAPGTTNPFEAMLSGIVQLQEVVADLAANKSTSTAATSGANPEVVRPGVNELVKLPSPTLEGALGFADWVHAVKPSMSDLSDTSGECWSKLLAESQDWYHNQYVPANPLARVRLKVPASATDREARWTRVKHRMEHLIIQCCPDSVKSELSASRTSGVLSILCKLHTVYKPGGVAERSEALRQVQHPRAADSPIDAVLRLRTWRRWMTRLTDLGGTTPDAAVSIQALEVIAGNVLKSLPTLAFRVNLVRASLNLDTQPTSSKVTEYFEHLLAELEGVSRVSEVVPPAGGSTTKGDSNKGVRQVDARPPSSGDGTAPASKDQRAPKPPVSPSATDSPKRLCKWFHEGKGCKRGKDCKFLHDWNQVPQSERADRCIACGGQGHRKNACPNMPSHAKRDDGASAKGSRSEPSPKHKSGDPGLRKVLTEAAGVLREAMSAGTGAGPTESTPGPGAQETQGAEPPGPQEASPFPGGPVMATAAKIQAQLEDLEARVLEGRPRVRAVSCVNQEEEQEPTALLDSGATHAVLDPQSSSDQQLVPCTVSLAGDQKQVWHQTPGGSLVAPMNAEGSTPQTILPLGCLVEQLGCSLRWSKKSGLQLVHPRLGKMRTSLKGGCPQLSRSQALLLIRELESAKLGELDGRLRRVQAQLKVSTGIQFDEALDDFVSVGSYTSAVAFARALPFLSSVPQSLVCDLAVGFNDVNGWEVLKGLPFHRRMRKRLYQSHSWVLHLSSSPVDLWLREMCNTRGVELVSLSGSGVGGVQPEVWKALSWGAYTGRVAAIVADAPMRTWLSVQTGEAQATRLRTTTHPWGSPTNTTAQQSKVESDTRAGVQPMWLWTLASIAKGEGIPFCQTQAVLPAGCHHPWLELVVKPFAEWSNCSKFVVAGIAEGGHQTRPVEVCTNLGFSPNGARSWSPLEALRGLPVKGHLPARFLREISLALFGCDCSSNEREPSDEAQVVAVSAREGEVHNSGHEVPDDSLEQQPEERKEQPSGGDAHPRDPCHGPKGSMSEKEREKWRRHIAAHHLPFRRDCLQCVMSGALGLQHRRVKCPSMYALSFDLTGPFVEKGVDERGGGYRYALVAGLRVPEIALPPEVSEGRAKGRAATSGEAQPGQVEASAPPLDDRDLEDIEWSGSEDSWMRVAEGHVALSKGPQVPSHEFDDAGSDTSWLHADLDLEKTRLEEVHEDVQTEEEPATRAPLPTEGPLEEASEDDPWGDSHGIAALSDEEFDRSIAQSTFTGANKVLRFVVPIKSRQGPQILAGLQEIVTECNRLGYPVKVAHTDRAKELMSKATMDWFQSKLIQPSFTQGDDPKANGLAERLVGWVKARARLHLAASGMGVERWPSAMEFACAEHRHRTLRLSEGLPRFGQKVVFKSKHPTGKSKRPFVRWEHAVYLHPASRTEGGHVLLRAASNAFLVAKNVRCTDELFDPEAALGTDVAEADLEEPVLEGSALPPPSRRVTGKRAIRAVRLASEVLAEDLLRTQAFTADDCARVLSLAFEGTSGGTKRLHRGVVDFSTVFGAYCHGGLRGVTRASHIHPALCNYLNCYLRHNYQGDVQANWTSLVVMVADTVALHSDSRNEPGSCNFVSHVTSRKLWVESAGGQPSVYTEGAVSCNRAEEGTSKEAPGHQAPVGQSVACFNPKSRHTLSRATNWVIAGYSPLGSNQLPSDDLVTLQTLGFRPRPVEQVPCICKLVGPNPQMLQPPRATRRPLPRPGRVGMNVRYARMPAREWEELCQLDEEQFEQRFDRWQRVLGGADEDPEMNPFSARIPQGLLVASVFEQRDWDQDPIFSVRQDDGAAIPIARVFQFSDDGYVDDTPYPDRMLLFSIHDYPRDVFEMIILRVEMIEVPDESQEGPALEVPGPPPPEIRAVHGLSAEKPQTSEHRLPIPLPNPTYLKCPLHDQRASVVEPEEASVSKAEATTTKDLESVLAGLTEPLCVTHTASQEEVRAHLHEWKSSIQKELDTLKGPGVLISHKGQEARDRLNSPSTTVIPLKGVFTAKPPNGPTDGLFRRKCRLVACGNQATHIDAESLYAAGAPAEVVRSALAQACRHKWSAFTTDIKSAFTQTPIPGHAAQRYLLRPPKWMIDLGLAEPGEYYSLGKVLYGFKEAPAWWSEHRDAKLLTARFQGCRLEQGQSDSSIWRIMKGRTLVGYLITYVDDFLVLSDRDTADGLHRWLLEGAGWETDGLSEAKPGSPIRFLGMQLCGYEDGHFSLDQEAYVDELVRSYGLPVSAKSRIACPKELLINDNQEIQPYDELAVRKAQRIAGECLWLSQRTRVDIAYTTSVLCAKVAKDPHGAIAVGQRLLAYLAYTKGYKLHLRPDPEAPPVRVFTDASFSPQGEHSYGGHVVEVYGVPVLWRASRQALIALSSSEAELIQAVEGCTYAESLMTVLSDLHIPCETAELNLDNTASISFIGGSGNQRTRHLKVRGHKIRQLIQSGWTVRHCRGEMQKADLLTKPLPSQRMLYLCGLLHLRPDPEGASLPAVKAVTAQTSPCLSGLVLLMQACTCLGNPDNEDAGSGVSIEWPWELAVVTLLIVLSTLFVWEATGAPCRRRRDAEVPHVRAVSVEQRTRRSRKLQERVKAAIDSVVSSPTEDEGPQRARGRNKCPPEAAQSSTPSSSSQGPTVVYGGISMHMHGAGLYEDGHPAPHASTLTSSSTMQSSYHPATAVEQLNAPASMRPLPDQPTGSEGHHRVLRGDFVRGPSSSKPSMQSQAVQTDPVVVLGPEDRVYLSEGGDCGHVSQNCRGLRQAGHVKTKKVCQYCIRHRGM